MDRFCPQVLGRGIIATIAGRVLGHVRDAQHPSKMAENSKVCHQNFWSNGIYIDVIRLSYDVRGHDIKINQFKPPQIAALAAVSSLVPTLSAGLSRKSVPHTLKRILCFIRSGV
jgi:hypothetical protein